MKLVHRINKEKFYLEDLILQDDENIPNDCIESRCPNGFYKPKWENGKWVEGLTQEEIEELKNTETVLPTFGEQLAAIGEQLTQEKLKNMQKDATISQLGQEIAMVKLEIIKMKGGN